MALPSDTEASITARQAVMAICAEAEVAELQAIADSFEPAREAFDLRPAGAGLVMLRGRMGGDGRAFNLGEATVARASVALPDGRIGFAYHLGRDLEKARAAALLDALWQGEDRSGVEAALAPIRRRLDSARNEGAARTAATRVNFFTLKRGEDS